jgi:hypothetical protein
MSSSSSRSWEPEISLTKTCTGGGGGDVRKSSRWTWKNWGQSGHGVLQGELSRHSFEGLRQDSWCIGRGSKRQPPDCCDRCVSRLHYTFQITICPLLDISSHSMALGASTRELQKTSTTPAPPPHRSYPLTASANMATAKRIFIRFKITAFS